MNKTINIRPAKDSDAAFLQHIAVASGLFQPEEMGEFKAMIEGFFEAQENDSFWLVSEQENKAVGAAFVGPEAFADRVFNLYFIAVEPDRQGAKIGSNLLLNVEQIVKDAGGRILIIETSGVGSFGKTRQFYRNHAYAEEARIREYYGPGDDKVTFWKKLS